MIAVELEDEFMVMNLSSKPAALIFALAFLRGKVLYVPLV